MSTYDIVREIVYIVYGAVVAYVARVYARVCDAHGQAQVVKLQGAVTNAAYAHRAIELVVLYHAWVELLGHPHRVPRRGAVVVHHQALNLVAAQVTPSLGRLFYLLVAYVVFILSFG